MLRWSKNETRFAFRLRVFFMPRFGVTRSRQLTQKGKKKKKKTNYNSAPHAARAIVKLY